MGESSESGIRVGDVERELAAHTLGEHLAAGRLTPAEHEERCANATIARTRGDIEALFADLPAPHPDLSKVVPPAKPVEPPKASETVAGAGCLLVMLCIVVAITLTIVYGAWWTFLVVGGLAVFVFGWSDVLERREARKQLRDGDPS